MSGCAFCGSVPAPVLVDMSGPQKRPRLTGDSMIASWHIQRELCEPCSEKLLRQLQTQELTT